MRGRTKARSSRSAVKSAARALSGKTICASTDVVNACGGEGEGESTIQPQRSLLHYRGNTLQLVKGDHVFTMVMTFQINVMSSLLISILFHNSIRASSLTPPEWEIAMFG